MCEAWASPCPSRRTYSESASRCLTAACDPLTL